LKQLIRPALALAAAALTLAAGPASNWNATVTRTPAQSHVVGNPAAKVKLTKWISYTCPACARFEVESDAALKLQYIRSGKVSVEVRHFVRDPVDLTVALLTNCGTKDRFQLNHAAFIRSQTVWLSNMARSTPAQQARWSNGDLPSRSRAIASDLRFYQIMATRGYDRIAVDRCLADTAMAKRLSDGTEAGTKLGIDHTPSFSIDGQLLLGTSGWSILEPQLQARM
jgi:protein-disulfide isomerase